jgi:hypothetical protein
MRVVKVIFMSVSTLKGSDQIGDYNYDLNAGYFLLIKLKFKDFYWKSTVKADF